MILLTAAFSPGDIDAGKSYTHLKVRQLVETVNKKAIIGVLDYGYLNEAVWVQGSAPALTVEIRGDDYDTLVAETPDNLDDSIRDQFGAKFYQYVIDEGLAAGTIV